MLKGFNIFFVGSVIFLVLALGLVALLDRTKTPGSSTDARAKAGVTNTLRMTGTISSVDETRGTVMVDSLQFLDNTDSKSLGTWTVTAPPSVNLVSLTVGARVTITVNPTTFLATSHTLTATEIKIVK